MNIYHNSYLRIYAVLVVSGSLQEIEQIVQETVIGWSGRLGHHGLGSSGWTNHVQLYHRSWKVNVRMIMCCKQSSEIFELRKNSVVIWIHNNHLVSHPNTSFEQCPIIMFVRHCSLSWVSYGKPILRTSRKHTHNNNYNDFCPFRWPK